MAPSLLPATRPFTSPPTPADPVAVQIPSFGQVGLEAEGGAQSTLLEQALSLLSAAEKRLAEQREWIAHLESLALTDILTGLPNRRALDQFLEQALAAARRYSETGVLCFIDLDNFKTVNDTLGHEAGDRVLERVAELLATNIRATDFVSRFGGDEFVILMVRTNSDEGTNRARQLQGMVNGSYALHGATRIYVRASFGILGYDSGSNAAALMGSADAAMYLDKKRRFGQRPRDAA